jgi:hypothetical protein
MSSRLTSKKTGRQMSRMPRLSKKLRVFRRMISDSVYRAVRADRLDLTALERGMAIFACTERSTAKMKAAPSLPTLLLKDSFSCDFM